MNNLFGNSDILDSNVEILKIRSDFIFVSDEENYQIMKIMKYFSSLINFEFRKKNTFFRS